MSVFLRKKKEEKKEEKLLKILTLAAISANPHHPEKTQTDKDSGQTGGWNQCYCYCGNVPANLCEAANAQHQ